MMWVETETVVELQSGIVAIQAYLQFECAFFVLKISFRFRLRCKFCNANRRCENNVTFPQLQRYDHFTPLTRFAYSRYEHSQRQYIGADVFLS
jgi:hypothetical protein